MASRTEVNVRRVPWMNGRLANFGTEITMNRPVERSEVRM